MEEIKVIGGPGTIDWGGKTYRVDPMELVDWGAALQQARKDYVDAARSTLDEESTMAQRMITERAALQGAFAIGRTSAELYEWIDSDKGMSWLLWWSFRKTDSKLTLEKVRRLIEKDAKVYIQARFDWYRINGFQVVKRTKGQDEGQEEARSAPAKPTNPIPEPSGSPRLVSESGGPTDHSSDQYVSEEAERL